MERRKTFFHSSKIDPKKSARFSTCSQKSTYLSPILTRISQASLISGGLLRLKSQFTYVSDLLLCKVMILNSKEGWWRWWFMHNYTHCILTSKALSHRVLLNNGMNVSSLNIYTVTHFSLSLTKYIFIESEILKIKKTWGRDDEAKQYMRERKKGEKM